MPNSLIPARSLRRDRKLVLQSLLGLALLTPCLMTTANAQMICMSVADPTLRPIQTLVTQDAAKALKAAQAEVVTLHGTANSDPARLASLYALEDQSYGMLELDADA